MCSRVLALLFTLSFAAGMTNYYVLRGEDIIMKPAIPKNPVKIIWRHGGKELVTFDGTVHEGGAFQNRVMLDPSNAELRVMNARFEDSGMFELQAFYQYHQEYALFHWEVLDNVTNTRICCKAERDAKANLACSASGRADFLSYEWILNGTRHQGTSLKIPLGGEHDEQVYVCRVFNPLSEEVVRFTAKDCYNEKYTGCSQVSNSTVTVAVILAIVFLGLIVTCIILRRKCNELKMCRCRHRVDY